LALISFKFDFIFTKLLHLCLAGNRINAESPPPGAGEGNFENRGFDIFSLLAGRPHGRPLLRREKNVSEAGILAGLVSIYIKGGVFSPFFPFLGCFGPKTGTFWSTFRELQQKSSARGSYFATKVVLLANFWVIFGILAAI